MGVESFGEDVKQRIQRRLLWAKEVCDGAWPPRAGENSGVERRIPPHMRGNDSICLASRIDTILLSLGSIGLIGWLAVLGMSVVKTKR